MEQFFIRVFSFLLAVLLLGWLVYRFGFRDWLRVRCERQERLQELKNLERQTDLLEKLVDSGEDDKK